MSIKVEVLSYFKGASRGSKALRQILYSMIIQGFGVVIGLLYIPLLLTYLTQEKYGIWLTLTSILGWFSFFDIGLGNGLRNKLTEVLAKGDLNLSKKLISTTYALLICIFSVVLFVFHISNFFINWNLILNTSTISSNELYILTSIVATFLIINFIVQLISVVYLADQLPSVTKAITTSGSLLSFIVVLILTKITIEGNLILLGTIISAIPVLLFIVVSIVSFNTKYKKIKPSIKDIDFTVSKGVVSLGVKFFFLQFSSVIVFTTSNFFIAQFYGLEEVTVFHIAFKYFQIPAMIFSIIMSPLWSAVTDAYTKSDYLWLKKTLKYSNLLSLVFSSGVFIMVLISNWVYKIWIGDKIIIPLGLSIALGINTIVILFINPFSYFINGIGKLKLTVICTVFEFIIYLCLVFLFRHIFENSIGIVVAIFATTFFSGLIMIMQTFKILNKTAKGIWNA